MRSVTILDKQVELEFTDDCDDEETVQTTLWSVDEMVDLINGIDWPNRQKSIFNMMDKIVFFRGEVSVNGWRSSRPCCDEDDATFYWEVGEFQQNSDADVHANTFFHDCCHVRQFQEAGNRYAASEKERVEREIDAINEQIVVAEMLGCDEREVSYLKGFRDSETRIRNRLAQGIEPDGPEAV